MTISEHINKLILAAIHYRNRDIMWKWIASERNRKKFYEASHELEQQKKRLLTAISKGTYIN